MKNTAKKEDVAEGTELTDSTSKIHQKLAKEQSALPADSDAYCLEQLGAQCDADSQPHRGVLASGEAIVSLQQTLKNMGCTDYQNIPRKQLEHLLALDAPKREQILQVISQFKPESIAASGNAEVSVVQYLEDVLNRKVHYAAVPGENAGSLSTKETVGRQQGSQIRTADNDAGITHCERISNLPITLWLSPIAASDYARVNIKVIIKHAFNVSSSGANFVLPELSVLMAHLEALRETDLSQDDVNTLIDIAKTCQQHSYVVHAVCIYALLYRAKEQHAHRDTHTQLFYQTQLASLLSQKPFEGKQIAFQSAQGTFHQPVAIQEADTWVDVALRFKQSSLMHYLLSQDESYHDFSIQLTNKEANDGMIEVERETVLHRLCRSSIADLSLYQRFVAMWPQALGARTPDFHLPLHKAACFADQNVFRYLVEETTNAWVQTDSQGNTLLHLAAMYANTEVVNLLLQQAGIDVNARNADNRTPLHCAAAGRQLDQGSTLADYEVVFNSLLAQGADPTCVDSHQETAKDMASTSANGRLFDVFDKALNRTAPERLWQYWQTAMMSYYSKETFVKKQLFNEDYFSLADYFVNLQLVKKRDDSADDRQQPHDDRPIYKPLRERDRLVGKKEVIELTDLFQPSIYTNSHGKSLPPINTVMLSGAAGVGKTTLVDYLAYQWALSKKGEGKTGLWSAFDMVLIVRCRDLHPEQIDSDIRTITQLLHRACWGSLRLSADDAQSLLARLEQSPARCLLLLDGLDELPELKQTYWRDLLVQLFQLPFKKLVTTRPYAIGTLQKWINHDGLVEISGFTDSNVAVYFEKMLGQSNETQAFIQAVKKNPDLWAITHTPIHAYLLKSWWVSTCSQTGSAQLAALSTSDLYRSLIVDVCRRYLAKTGKLNGSELLDDEVVLDDSRVHCLLKTLGYWAFEGLRQNTAQLSTRWLSGVQGSDEEPTLLWTNQFKQLNVDYLKALGLLKQVGNNISTQQCFEFLHLSFQEFLAASAIAVTLRIGTEDEKTHITHVIHAYKYHLNFTLVWPMVSGLLKGYPSVLNDFLSHLIAGPRDWVGFVEFELLMRCLESSLALNTDTNTLCSQQKGLLWIIRLRIRQLDTLPDSWHKSTLNILSMCPKLARLNVDAVLAFFQNQLVSVWVRRELVASAAVASLLKNTSVVEARLTFHQSGCTEELIRCYLAVRAAVSLSESPSVVEAVLTFLQDKNGDRWHRCNLAAITAVSLSENSDFVGAVLALLKDQRVDGRARCDLAARTVALLSEKPSFVETVLTLLRDQHVYGGFRCYLAIIVVASMSEKSGVVDAVLTLLQDQRVYGKDRGKLLRSAVASLSEQPGFVEKVLMLLQDSSVNEKVRCDLAANLIASLPKNSGVVKMVFMLLRDQCVDGRARCELAENAAVLLSKNPGVVETVLTHIRDQREDAWVRCKLAASAVASLSENPDVVKVVLTLLWDSRVHVWIRCKLAAITVASLSENPDFLYTVLTILRHPRVDGKARCELAASAVASLSEKPGFLFTVLMLLWDPRVDGKARCDLAASAVTSLSEKPGFVTTVLALLKDSRVDGRARCELAASAVASLSEKPCFVTTVLTLLPDSCVDEWARCKLAASAIASLSENHNVVDAVLTLLQDPCVAGRYRCGLAAIFIVSLPKNSGVVKTVLMLLRDPRVNGGARRELAAAAVASLSENPDIVDAVLTLLCDQSTDRRARFALAEIACDHCTKWAKWPNKLLAFFNSLFVKDHYGEELLWHINIPVHVMLPLYEKTHEKGRHYIKVQLVNHRVLVYDRAGTVLVRQAGQTEHLRLSRSTIQQVKQDLQSLTGNQVSGLSQLGFFATSTTTNSSLTFRSIKSCFFL